MSSLHDLPKHIFRMLESGVNKALELNLELRSYIKQHTPK